MSTIIHNRYIVNPYKFNMWIAIVAMVMMFAAFTSAYVVKKGDLKTWQDIQLPAVFTVSTIVIVLSSISLHAAYLSFKTNRISLYRGFIVLTFILGAAFLTLQIQGWTQLVNSGIALSGNVAGSFIYVISGAHFLHVVGGVIALMVFSILAFTRNSIRQNNNVDGPYLKKLTGVEILMTYWHFVDILWVYLYFFFIINN